MNQFDCIKQVAYLSNRLYSFVVKEPRQGKFRSKEIARSKSSLGKESIISSLKSLVREILRELFLYFKRKSENFNRDIYA